MGRRGGGERGAPSTPRPPLGNRENHRTLPSPARTSCSQADFLVFSLILLVLVGLTRVSRVFFFSRVFVGVAMSSWSCFRCLVSVDGCFLVFLGFYLSAVWVLTFSVTFFLCLCSLPPQPLGPPRIPSLDFSWVLMLGPGCAYRSKSFFLGLPQGSSRPQPNPTQPNPTPTPHLHSHHLHLRSHFGSRVGYCWGNFRRLGSASRAIVFKWGTSLCLHQC